MSSTFQIDACGDESQSVLMETSLWDDVPSINPYLTPPRHESTPSRKSYTRRSVRLSTRKKVIPCDENTPINTDKSRKRARAATTPKKRVTKPIKPVNLWDKAMKKNKELAKFIESYNEQMDKICSTELSIRSEPNTSISWLETDSMNSSALDDEV